MGIYKSIVELVGHTPLIELSKIEKSHALGARLIVKLEGMNPGGSAKDRVALGIIEELERSGKLTPDTVIIEPTSGNTGIGLAMVAAERGYHVMIVMPENMSEERKLLMRAYGADLVLTDAERGMAGAIEMADLLAAGFDSAVIAGQFTNPENPLAHERTTGPEIYLDTEGGVDIFVAGVGTGGTVTGVGRYLKSNKPEALVVGVEPERSAVLSGGEAGSHGIQGIGAGFVPEILDREVIDEIATVSLEEALAAARLIAKEEGILVGISSGAALAVALRYAKMPENKGKMIVALLADSGERYLSAGLYE